MPDKYSRARAHTHIELKVGALRRRGAAQEERVVRRELYVGRRAAVVLQRAREVRLLALGDCHSERSRERRAPPLERRGRREVRVARRLSARRVSARGRERRLDAKSVVHTGSNSTRRREASFITRTWEK